MTQSPTNQLPASAEPADAELQALAAHHDFQPRDPARDQRVFAAMDQALAKKRAAVPPASGSGAAVSARAAATATATSRPRLIRRPWFAILAASAASLIVGLAVGLWVVNTVNAPVRQATDVTPDDSKSVRDDSGKKSPAWANLAHLDTPPSSGQPAPVLDQPPAKPPVQVKEPNRDTPNAWTKNIEPRGHITDLTGNETQPAAGPSIGGYGTVGAVGAGGTSNGNGEQGSTWRAPAATPTPPPPAGPMASQPEILDITPPAPAAPATEPRARPAYPVPADVGTPNIKDADDEKSQNSYVKSPAADLAPRGQTDLSQPAGLMGADSANHSSGQSAAAPQGQPGTQPGTQPSTRPSAVRRPPLDSSAPADPRTAMAEYPASTTTAPPTHPSPAPTPAPVTPTKPVTPGDVNGPFKPDDGDKKPGPSTWRRSGLVPNTARLMVGDNAELPLTGMQANIHVDGFRARVVIDLYFYNDRAQQLQGNFNLRLPDGASPYYFAFGETAFQVVDGRAAKDPVLFGRDKAMHISFRPDQIVADRRDSWLQPKEARMVPREKAALAYRDTVYNRRVDPALLEWSGAGIFAAHVFPLQAQKLHRIVIGYDVDLSRQNGALTYRFDLPGSVPTLAVDLSVATLRDDTGGHLQVSPEAKPFGVNDYAYFRYDNPQADAITVKLDPAWAKAVKKDDLVDIAPNTDQNPKHEWVHAGLTPAALATDAVLLTGAEAGSNGGANSYFAAQFVPALPTLPAAGGVAPNAVFLLDTSYSLTPDKFNTYRNLLARILNANRDGGLKRFKVLFFNITTHAWQEEWTDNTEANVNAVLQAIDQTVLEGASDLSQALAAAGFDSEALYTTADPATRTDFFLLSDGATTWGATDLSQPVVAAGVHRPRAREVNSLFAYLVGNQGNDRLAVETVAQQTGGAVFTINSDDDIPAVAVAHRSQAWEVGSISMPGVSDLLIVGNPRALYPNQPVTVVGRGLPPENAVFTLNLRMGKTVQNLTVPVAHRITSELAPRIYGQAAVDRLERSLAGEDAFATAYACHFRVTGQTCSLLMLESEADYQRYNIRTEQFDFSVQSTPISTLLARHANAAGDYAGSAAQLGATAQKPGAQQTFIAWVGRLQAMPGLRFNPTPAFLTALGAMPPESFQIPEESLGHGTRYRSQLDAGYLATLAKGSPTAADLWPEVLRCRRSGNAAGALIAASTRVELAPGDAPTLREAAYLALDLGFRGHACNLLKRVADQRPFEADTYLTLAQALAENGNADLALAYYEIALSTEWDGRYGAYHDIVSTCYLDFLDRVAAGQYIVAVPEYATARRNGMTANAGHPCMDLVTTVQWNTDGTDVDLHVIEPNGEDCGYQHPQTRSGGQITHDVTTGFGPEMYTLNTAPRGNYKIYVHFYAQDRTRISGATSAYVTVIRKFGSAKPEIFHRVVLLESNKEKHDLAVVIFQ